MDFIEWLVTVKEIPFYNFLSDEEWDTLFEEYLAEHEFQEEIIP